VDYYIERAESLDELEERVKKMLNQGWTPQGGIAVRSYSKGEGCLYIQALTKMK
jgi:tRNA(Ser,Leu) C12 N-acetylase TAN1